MRVLPFLIVIAFAVATAAPAPAQQGFRSCAALLIGNSGYQAPPLKEPGSDARALGAELERTGINVDVKENLTQDEMRRALDGFYQKLEPGMVGVFFFSGYGIQINRQSFLIPIDAEIFNETDVPTYGISLDKILSEMHSRVDVKKLNAPGAGTRTKDQGGAIVILDAARRINPFEKFRRPGIGLAPASLPEDALILYSARAGTPGGTNPDSPTERGLFVNELIKELRTPNAPTEEVLSRTRVGVIRASGGERNPQISTTLSRDVSFASCAKNYAGRHEASPNPPQPMPAPLPLPTPPIICGSVDAPRPKALPIPKDELKELDDRIQQNPGNPTQLYFRGQLYATYNNFAKAISDFDAALHLKPNDSVALNNRCWARIMLGETGDALKDCNEALKIKGDYGNALDSRGLIFLKLCKNSEALADYDAALKNNPGSASSLFGRGVAKLLLGEDLGGNKDIDNAVAINSGIAEEFKSYGIRLPSNTRAQQ